MSQIASTAQALEEQLRGRASTSKPAALKHKRSWNPPNWSKLFQAVQTVEELGQKLPRVHGHVELTPDLWAILHEINDLVNDQVISRSDHQIFGVDDYWALPFERSGPPLGDCEDFVLQKRQLLISRGLPPSVLSIAVVRVAEDSTHAVLLVDSDSGVYILDSLSPWILASNKTNYRWMEHQVGGEAFKWEFGPPHRS